MGKSIQADRAFDPGSPKERREDVRVFPDGLPVNIRVHKSKTLDERILSAKIIDLSAGGMSIKLPSDFKLSKNGTASFELSFLDPPHVIKGVFLGLQYDE